MKFYRGDLVFVVYLEILMPRYFMQKELRILRTYPEQNKKKKSKSIFLRNVFYEINWQETVRGVYFGLMYSYIFNFLERQEGQVMLIRR